MNNFSKNINRIAKILFAACFVFLLTHEAKAQDKIHKKNGKILNVKIIEVGVEDIRYRQQDQPDGVIYAVEKVDVEKVVLENGLVQKFGDSNLDNSELYQSQRKQALKVSFLAPLAGYTRFTYERAIKPGHSWEAKLGIVGLGQQGGLDGSLGSSQVRQSGVFVAGGYKYILQPSYYLSRQRYAHILKGSYFRPEIAFGSYAESQNRIFWTGSGWASTTQRYTTSYFCFILSGGKQWIINDRFLIDISYGIGYGGYRSNQPSGELFDFSATNYGYTILSNGLATSSTLNIGFLLNNPKKQK